MRVFRRSLLIWTLFCILAGVVFLAYTFVSLAAGRGELVLPLDDVYIHFQYARQMANGQPYVYNPGQPPTSGATSFLYPFVLAAGYLMGFHGLNLGLWAMFVGALALLGSLWLVYRLSLAFGAAHWLALLAALIFGLTGAIQWHFMSGMETGLMILFTLATLYAVVTGQLWLFVLAASLMALTRPEGGALAMIAVGIMFVVGTRRAPQALPPVAVSLQRQRLWLLIPSLAIFVQPLVNLLVTGSAVATGNAAKSIFGTVPFYWDVVLRRIAENFARMWAEFFTGVSPREGLYIPYGVGQLALLALVMSLVRRDRWHASLMVILWLLAGTAAIATLDTAFWHFKRYQIPLMALFYPLAAWELTQITRFVGVQRAVPLRYAVSGLVAAGLVIALTTSAAFLHHFVLNVNYVTLQPLQMARWLRQNTPKDALIAVHDVGMMRYIGRRDTLDMVGLTTPGAAAYWRNGPGSIAEFLIQERPDYIASYGEGHGLGLGMIAQTSLYGDPLAEFPVVLDDHYNVALAADTQGIYQPDTVIESLSNEDVKDYPSDGEFIWQTINVTDLASEAQYNYSWYSLGYTGGFPTEIHELSGGAICPSLPDCTWPMTVRRINGGDSFTLKPTPGYSLLLLTVVHPVNAGTLDYYVNDEFVDRQWIPEMPGQYLILSTPVPSHMLAGEEIHVRIEANVGNGFYYPALYGALETSGGNDYMLDTVPPDSQPSAVFQDGALMLFTDVPVVSKNELTLNSMWFSNGEAEGDYRFFTHLYANASEPPIAQMDNYLLDGTALPGNMPPGEYEDSVVVDLDGVPPGTYQLAIGFYNPYTGERLMPESEVYEVSPDGRLWLGEVEVPG